MIQKYATRSTADGEEDSVMARMMMLPRYYLDAYSWIAATHTIEVPTTITTPRLFVFVANHYSVVRHHYIRTSSTIASLQAIEY